MYSRLSNIVPCAPRQWPSCVTLVATRDDQGQKTTKIRTDMGNVVFSIIWFIVLIFVGFWVAGIAAGFYVLFLPFTVCISDLSGLTDFLLMVVQFPRYCAQAMMDGKGFS